MTEIDKVSENNTEQNESQKKYDSMPRMPLNVERPKIIFWRQHATDQLDFRLMCDLSRETGDFMFLIELTGGNL